MVECVVVGYICVYLLVERDVIEVAAKHCFFLCSIRITHFPLFGVIYSPAFQSSTDDCFLRSNIVIIIFRRLLSMSTGVSNKSTDEMMMRLIDDSIGNW